MAKLNIANGESGSSVRTKLNTVDNGATDDQTGAEIKTAYEAEADTNAFTDAEQTKLTGIETSADVTDATNVAAAGAVMDSDVSAGEGFLRKTGAGAYEAIKSNLGASTDPGATDDSASGYAVGSRWINTTGDKEFVCLDATATSAVWTETTSAGGGGGTSDIVIAVSDEDSDLTTGTAKVTFRMPQAMTLTGVKASVTTAPTGSTIIVDINEGGVSILSTELSIDATEETSVTAAVAAVISDASLAADAEITIDIDQVGSTVAGTGLKVTLLG